MLRVELIREAQRLWAEGNYKDRQSLSLRKGLPGTNYKFPNRALCL